MKNKILIIVLSLLLFSGCQTVKNSENLQGKIFKVYCDNLRLVSLHQISSSSDYYKQIAQNSGNGSDVISQNAVASNLLWEYITSGQRRTVNELKEYKWKGFQETISQLTEANDGIIGSLEKIKKVQSFEEFREVFTDYSTYRKILIWIPDTFNQEINGKSIEPLWSGKLLKMSTEIDMCNNQISVDYWDWESS